MDITDDAPPTRTGWLCHERFFWHDTSGYSGMLPSGGWLQPLHHFDEADTKRRFANLVEVSGLRAVLEPLSARPATDEELLRRHTPAHLERVRALSAAGGGDAGDGESPFGADGSTIGALAAGGVIEALDAVVRGRVRNAFALVLPPGHHALAESGMGFCTYANIALAVMAARAERGVERVAVVDWDVHHGNGTEAAFAADPDVLTISLHQDALYPLGSGRVEDRGTGEGVGAVVNVPLPGGSGHEAYLHAVERVVLPALRAFRPDVVVIACGFDACAFDPLGRMDLHSESYRAMTAQVMGVADEVCGGRVLAVQEGGYSPLYLPFCGLAVVEQLAGVRTEVVDPYLDILIDGPGSALEPHQRAAVDRAAAAVDLDRLRR